MRLSLLLTFMTFALSAFRPNPNPHSPLRQTTNHFRKHYHHSQLYYEEAIKRLNSKNITTQTDSILNRRAQFDNAPNQNETDYPNGSELPEIKIIIQGGFLNLNNGQFDDDHDPTDEFNPFNIFEQQSRQQDEDEQRRRRQGLDRPERIKSKNFEVVKNYPIKFNDVGGYEKIKDELRQSIDILKNFQKYQKYNVRIPKGLILEGPPGNGKTLIAKSIAGESGCGFIAVSGSDFQEKYVGVGSSRIRELFELAKKNSPCIIFIDEIDAIGRKRSGDGESSSSERDNTLNSILVELDGFKNNTGIFLVGATNRIDLLDPALLRPGRIDKKIFIGLPDLKTRTAVLGIHITGKPHDKSIQIPDLVELTDGLSCAQIESLLNEAMLFALRKNRTAFNYDDVNVIFNKIIAGWQSTDHEFSQDMIDRITVHEMGHAILGFLSKYHSRMLKVVLNLSSPKTPGYTVFERSASSIYLKEALFEHLIILLGGRIAEEVVYNVSITTGAINDFEEALKLAERMIVYYGMGENVLYPSSSEKYKEIIDNEVSLLINNAYRLGRGVLENCHDIIVATSIRLQKEKQLNAAVLSEIIHETYPEVLTLKETF
jgi:cell division protease FtsH